jgi:hypothetical protein
MIIVGARLLKCAESIIVRKKKYGKVQWRDRNVKLDESFVR